MAKLNKQRYRTMKNEIKINCYTVNLSKEIVKQANIKDDDEIKISVKDNKIIIEKDPTNEERR